MTKRVPISAFLIALVGIISGTIYYLGKPAAPAESTGTLVEAQVSAQATSLPRSAEGELKTVTKAPRIAKGRLEPEASSMEEFSSNPKRSPEEKLVIKISADRDLSDEEKVKQLLGLIPTLPPDAQTLAMENATSLIPDGEYLKHREHLLRLANTPEMRVAVMDDSLTRGEEIRLPNLLELMRSSKSDEEKQEIREIFEAYLDHDYGPNPVSWEAPLRQWVAENTDS